MGWDCAVFLTCGSIFEHPEGYALITKQGNGNHIISSPTHDPATLHANQLEAEVLRLVEGIQEDESKVCSPLQQ